MVVDDIEDLDVGVVGEPPVGDVGLPAFVGLFGGEAQVAALGRLCGCGVTNPRASGSARSSIPPGLPVALVEVKRDRRRTGLMPVPLQLLADRDDLLLDAGGLR